MQLPTRFDGSSDAEIRLMDFKPQHFCGTTLYMPPEVLNNEPYDRNAADVWAMGLVLCEMIVGFPPFMTVEGVIRAQLYCGGGEGIRAALLPVWYIVGSCLHWDYCLRPSAAELQLCDAYFPIFLERQTFFGEDIENHWADGMVP